MMQPAWTEMTEWKWAVVVKQSAWEVNQKSLVKSRAIARILKKRDRLTIDIGASLR
jgi:hypothetical protein